MHTNLCDSVEEGPNWHFDGSIVPEVTAALANRLISCPTPQAKLVSRPALNQSDYSRPYSQVVKINTPFL